MLGIDYFEPSRALLYPFLPGADQDVNSDAPRCKAWTCMYVVFVLIRWQQIDNSIFVIGPLICVVLDLLMSCQLIIKWIRYQSRLAYICHVLLVLSSVTQYTPQRNLPTALLTHQLHFFMPRGSNCTSSLPCPYCVILLITVYLGAN